MTVSVSNTNLNDNFNSWRLNTNYAATIISNNVVTVSRAGAANRGGVATGNGHIIGTFSANTLRADVLRSGNTSDPGGFLQILSNTSINAHSLSITSNTIFQGNVNFITTGLNRIILGDVSRIRMTGGNRGQFLRQQNQNDVLEFKTLSLRDIGDMSSNSAHLILSGANTDFSDNNDSPALILSNGNDRAKLYMASSTSLGESDVYLNLVDDQGDSQFVIADSSNNAVLSVKSTGQVTFTSNITVGGVSTTGNMLPESGYDDQLDLGAPNREWRNLWVDGVANIDELSIATGSGQGVSTSLIPKTDAAGNLGSTTRKWGTVWADTTNGGAGVFKGLGVSENINANGNLTVEGTADITGATTLSNTLTVNGQSVFNENAQFSANAVFQDQLQVTGNTHLRGPIELGDASTDTITVKGTFANQSTSGLSTFDGNMKIQGTWVEVNGTKVRGTVSPDVDDGVGHYNLGSTSERFNAIYANTTYSNNIFVDNNATINGDLTIVGSTTLSEGSTITSPAGSFTELTVATDSDLEGDVNIGLSTADNLTINSSIDSNLIPDGTRNIGSMTNQWNNLYLSGSLYDGSTTIISKNNKLHANNTITDGTIRDVMLEDSGVTAGSYGSASLVPQITVDSKGLITSMSTTAVAGVTSFGYSSGTFTIGTATGEDFTAIVPNATTTVKGISSFNTNDFSVTSGAVSIKPGGVSTAQLAAVSGLTSGEFGDSITVPTINVNTKGQITSISETAIPTATTSDGSTGTKGLAKFSNEVFNVDENGVVSLAGGAGSAILSIQGTTNEVDIERNAGTVTVGLPNDVTVSGQLNIGENVVIAGNLIVQGTTTTVDTETVNIADNIIVLNSDVEGAPSQDSGISIERGSETNVQLLWDETNDRWTFGEYDVVATNFIGSASQVSNSLTPGSYLTGTAYNGSSAKTFAVDATVGSSQDVGGNKIVARNGDGDFYARVVYGNLQGISAASLAWATPRNLVLGNHLSGSVSIDGSQGVVLNATIADDAVDTDQINRGAVTANELDIDAVITDRIQDLAVTGDKIDNTTITGEKLALKTVDTDQIADNAINRAKMADDAVGSAELRQVVDLRLKNSQGTTLKVIYGAGA